MNFFTNPEISISHGFSSLLRANLLLGVCFHFNNSIGDVLVDPGAIADAYQNNVIVKSFELVAGNDHACLLGPEGVNCWGSNSAGQSSVPSLVKPVHLAAGGAFTCAIDQGNVVCWGANDKGQTTVPTLSNPVEVSAGEAHACAIDDNGVHCWGDNTYGQTTVPLLNAPKSVSAGGKHTCAVDHDGVHCWGSNDSGQLTIPELYYPHSVYTGYSHSCALDQATSTLSCWGSDPDGRTEVPSLDGIMMVSAGWDNTCAIDVQTTEYLIDYYRLSCWGSNANQQLAMPAMISPPLVAIGNGFICAADEDAVKCWGKNDQGQASPPDMVWDPDGDGLVYAQEVAQHTSPLFADTDGDNLGDHGDPIPDNGVLLNDIHGAATKGASGSALAYAGDFDDDGYGDYVIGTPGYDVPATGASQFIKNAGNADVISGRNGKVLASVHGDVEKDGFGYSVAGGKDIDGDGYDDVVMGAPLADDVINGIKDVGAVRIIYGPDGARTKTFYGSQAKALFGSSVALGDLDKDGYPELIVGAPHADDAVNNRKTAGSITLIDHNGATTNSYYGDTSHASLGISLTSCDVDGDGTSDVIAGAPGAAVSNLAAAGQVQVFSSISSNEITVLQGSQQNGHFGQSVACGNIDGDTKPDLLIGATGETDPAGNVKVGGSVTAIAGNGFTLLAKHYGASRKAMLGASVALGDVNGDGADDLIAGAPRDFGWTWPNARKARTGSVSVWSGSDDSELAFIYSDAANDALGTAVATGDINSDGYMDLIYSRPRRDQPKPEKQHDTGEVLVLSGIYASQ